MVAVTRLSATARLPTRAYEGDGAFDLYADQALQIEPGERASVPTGVAVAIPDGHAGLVLPRSGLALAHGIALVNAPGLIDSGYRGELRVLLLNTDARARFEVELGARIAQLLIVALAPVELRELASLPDSERGERGFGSSG